MPKNTGVLAHYQDRSARATDLIPSDVADQWVQCMAAERISRRIIRLLPPDSIFPRAQNFPQQHYELALSSAECSCRVENRPNVKRTPVEKCPVDSHRIIETGPELHGLKFSRPNPQSYAAARRQEALNAIECYTWS